MQKIWKMDGALLRNFNWPSDNGETWRHLSDFSLFKGKGVVEDMFIDNGRYRATGTLLATPGSNRASIKNVEVVVVSCSIDFGRSLDDAARGYWMKGEPISGDPNESDTWYKMELPDKDYQKYSDKMHYKTKKILLLHDVITKSDNELITQNPITRLYICKHKIQELFTKTNEAFDINFVKMNCEFVLDHLKQNLDALKCKDFLKSILDIGRVKVTRKDFHTLFPEIGAIYKKKKKELKKRMNFRIKEVRNPSKQAISTPNTDIRPILTSKFTSNSTSNSIPNSSSSSMVSSTSSSSSISNKRKQENLSEADDIILKKKKILATPTPTATPSTALGMIPSSRKEKNGPVALKKNNGYIERLDELFQKRTIEEKNKVLDNSDRIIKIRFTDEINGKLNQYYIVNYEELLPVESTDRIIKSILTVKEHV